MLRYSTPSNDSVCFKAIITANGTAVRKQADAAQVCSVEKRNNNRSFWSKGHVTVLIVSRVETLQLPSVTGAQAESSSERPLPTTASHHHPLRTSKSSRAFFVTGRPSPPTPYHPLQKWPLPPPESPSPPRSPLRSTPSSPWSSSLDESHWDTSKP